MPTIIQQAAPRSEDGFPVQAPTFESTGGLQPQWHGHLYVVVAGKTNIFDELVVTEKMLRGGWYEVLDGAPALGDYIEQAVVDKDDVLGLFGAYGLTVGQDVLELVKYVKTEYVNPATAMHRQPFAAPSAFSIIAGLYLRVIYESVGTDALQLKVTTLAYE